MRSFPFSPRDSLMKLDRRSLYVLQNVSQLTIHSGKDVRNWVTIIHIFVFHSFVCLLDADCGKSTALCSIIDRNRFLVMIRSPYVFAV